MRARCIADRDEILDMRWTDDGYPFSIEESAYRIFRGRLSCCFVRLADTLIFFDSGCSSFQFNFSALRASAGQVRRQRLGHIQLAELAWLETSISTL